MTGLQDSPGGHVIYHEGVCLLEGFKTEDARGKYLSASGRHTKRPYGQGPNRSGRGGGGGIAFRELHGM